MRNLQTEILLTLAYTTQFSYPLTTTELWIRLLNTKYLSDVRHKPSPQAFAKSLIDLKSRQITHYVPPYWNLQKEFHNKTRQTREAIAQEKISQLRPVVWFALICPWVAGLAITGSAALKNTTLQDDVDLMIVAENNRLWLVRPLMIALSFFYGRRRSWNKEEPNSWCFNLWLERRSMQMPYERRSVYTAYEACQTKWLVSKGKAKQEFFWQNVWIEVLLPSYFSHSKDTPALYGYKHDTSKFPVIEKLFDFLNKIAYNLQLKYMHRHITTERVGQSYAFFHPRDTRGLIYQNWKKNLKFSRT